MEESLAWAMFEAGTGHCSAAIQGNGGLLVALLFAGLLGSWTHCVGMCGPLVLSQVSARLEGIPAARLRECHRWSGALLVPYHLGRMITYAGLGALTATITAGVERVPAFRWLGATLLGLAALSFLLSACAKLSVCAELRGWGTFPEPGNVNGVASVARSLVRPLLAVPGAATGWRGFRLGLALGFIPCGLVYGALAAAAASANPLTGAFAMIAFALGTVPALVVIGFAGHIAGRALPALVARVLPALMVINAAGLALLAWRLISS
ncbi:MAG: sulfite exporter TauE/SafE family protein [Rhodospirillaceae bacterium]